MPVPPAASTRAITCPSCAGLQSESVHLVATDPPFKKDRDFGDAFQDRWSWERNVRREWWDEITERRPALRAVIEAARLTADDSMGAYLCWLSIRLLEMHRLLRMDGSLYLHIDHTTHAYVKLLLDAIFGVDHFRNEIVWFYKTGGISKRWFGRKHDTILFYSKSETYTFHPQREKSYLTHKYGFSNIDIERDERGYFRRVAMRDVWDIPALRGNQAEVTGFPTQKPLALYERIIKASSNPGDNRPRPLQWQRHHSRRRGKSWAGAGWRWISGTGPTSCCWLVWKRRGWENCRSGTSPKASGLAARNYPPGQMLSQGTPSLSPSRRPQPQLFS